MRMMLIKFFVLIIVTIVLAEVFNASFKLINQSETDTFYLGLILLISSLYFCVNHWYKLVKNFVKILEQESIDENEK
jgi:hypothetical protein